MKLSFFILMTAIFIPLLARGQTYQTDWHVIASGGGHSESADYGIDGTIGQAIVGISTSANYRVEAGFWVGAMPGGPRQFAYLAGDANMFNEIVNPGNPLSGPWRVGGDVTFLVNYFVIGSGNQPCLMYNSDAPEVGGINEGYFYASGDATGDCQALGGDVSRLVQFFGGNPAAIIRWCGFDKPEPQDYFPPLWLNNRGSGLEQPVAPLEELPEGWPNCQIPPATARVIPTGSPNP